MGMVRQFIIERVQPKDFNEDEIDSIRTFYCDDEDNMFERFLSSWVQMHLNYLSWYARVLLDYSVPLEELLSPPVVPAARSSRNVLIQRYGLLFRCYDLVSLGVWTLMRISPIIQRYYNQEGKNRLTGGVARQGKNHSIIHG